jgi:SAM-dependent methyltransferase
MSDSDATYRFGSGFGENEIARFELADKIDAPATRMIFTEAGIGPGMRVLDLGCGTGNATFVAAGLVGPSGSVTGVDHSPDALARARYRAAQRGLAQVQFIEGDIHDPAPGGPYDAIVEHYALWLVPDPAEVLRRQATVLRPGGLIVAIEQDASAARSLPETALTTQWNSWGAEAMARAGLDVSLGPRLWAVAEEAGLRPRGMLGIAPHVGPGDEDGLAYLVQIFRGMEPLLVGTGVATAEEIGVETFEQRLRDEWEKTRMVHAAGLSLGVWATTGPE